jgi:hypothetical protein
MDTETVNLLEVGEMTRFSSRRNPSEAYQAFDAKRALRKASTGAGLAPDGYRPFSIRLATAGLGTGP